MDNDGKKTIMVVDDDEINLQMAQFILQKELDANVLLADNGYSCIEQLQKGADIDLILLDIQMPRMNGIKTLETIRKHAEWTKIPVMFLTAAADKETVIKAGMLGVAGYIKKPFMPKDLVERVSKLFLMSTLDDPEIAKMLKSLE